MIGEAESVEHEQVPRCVPSCAITVNQTSVLILYRMSNEELEVSSAQRYIYAYLTGLCLLLTVLYLELCFSFSTCVVWQLVFGTGREGF